MERCHKPAIRSWISKLFSIKTFRQIWLRSLSDYYSYEINSEHLLRLENISEDIISELEKECCVKVLDCDYDEDVELARNFELRRDVDLNTLRSQKRDLGKRSLSTRYRSFVYNNWKYLNYPADKAIGNPKKDATENRPTGKVDSTDVLIIVQFYRPEQAIRRYQNLTPSRLPVFVVDQEYCVLGCQYLTELRDVITCVSDMAIPGDFSDEPLQETTIKCGELMKSGFFYINGVFYNDMRDPYAINYSKDIIEWAKSSHREIGPFTMKMMETSQFIELEIQLGYPYVYVHQGFCEHIFVFSDLRMICTHDSLERSEYPINQRLIPKKRIFCMCCHIHTAKWVVSKNKRLPEEPYFFCDRCFFAFNYDENNKKIGEFVARKYCDRTVFL